MAGGAQFGGPVPRRLVGGYYRQLAEHYRLIGALAPFVAVGFLTVAAIGVVGLLAGTAGLIVSTLAVVAATWTGRRRIYARAAGAWWRAEWPWAARSAGLVILAELDIDRSHTPAETTIEAAPHLVKVIWRRSGRSYIVRPLPGQTVDQYVKAAESLVLRWRAMSVTVARDVGKRGRGRLRIDVTIGGAIEQAHPLDVGPIRAPRTHSGPRVPTLTDLASRSFTGPSRPDQTPRWTDQPVVERWTDGDVSHTAYRVTFGAVVGRMLGRHQ